MSRTILTTTTKQIRCPGSGLVGWQGKLQDQYKTADELVSFSHTYGLHTRLDYQTPEEAWEDNPTIQGSIEPSDFRKVSTLKIYLHLHGKNFIPPGTWFDECYGPFNSQTGAAKAKKLLDLINSNTGEYHSKVKVIRRKTEPEFRTLAWADWVATARIGDRAETLEFATI